MTAEEYRQQLLDIAHRLTLLATGESPALVPVPLPDPYPRVVTVDGARFMLSAPVNPLWKPSQYGRMFGQRTVLPEPSNAQPGQPLRSPAGYPLVYGVGAPRLLYGDSSFADDAKVAEYIAAVAASQAGAEQRDKDEGNVFRTPSEVEVRVEQG